MLPGYHEEENMDDDECPAFPGTMGLPYVITIERKTLTIQK